jgi:hypothetical protein
MDSRTAIMQGAPCTELTVKFNFLYLRAEELARFLLILDQVYNRVLQVAKDLDDPYSILPEERLRTISIQVELEAEITLRGTILKELSGSEGKVIGALDLIRDILKRTMTEAAESCPQNLLTAGKCKSGASVACDSDGTVNKEEAAEVKTWLTELRGQVAQATRDILPQAKEKDVHDIAELVFQIPGEVFQRRNLWGLKLE